MAETAAIAATASHRSQADWEQTVRALVEEGQNFLAHDVARDGLKLYPGSFKLAIYGAVALSQTGAVDEARKLLQPVLDVILIDEGPFHRLHESLKRAVETLSGEPGKHGLSAMADLAEALELVRGKKLVATADAETYTALAGVFREAWRASGLKTDLEHCRELFLRAFHAGGSAGDGVDAAVMSWLLGDRGSAHDLAAQVHDRISVAETELDLTVEQRYQQLATLARSQLLLGEEEAAIGSFEWARTLEGVHYGTIVAVLRQLDLLKEGGIDVPDAIFDMVKPPTVVVFTGHALDRPGEGPHFPAGLEATVKAEIAKSLDELDAQVGYCTAACGSDLLFIEAMLERGAEVNVVMPFDMDDFIAENVRYAGARWEMRFRNALKLASTVTYATEERFLGHNMLYRFANQCLHGLATLRAGFLMTTPYLLAVWDMMPGSLVGGAGDFIDQWEDISRLRIIDLDGLLQQHPELVGEDGPALPDLDLGGDGDDEQGEGRVIRSMMFCDIAGYSKLKEEHVPVFLEFLQKLKDGLASAGLEPLAINTWGDAIFAVMDKATPMAEYAMTLQEMVLQADEELKDKLPHPLNLRISLHGGPVFQAIDPICGRKNFYGSHINRAARLEPVTVIGHVYATQQFVALLTAEQSAMRSEATNRGEEFEEKFVCEYVGVLSLAKDFGKQTVYHLRRKVAAEVMASPAGEFADAAVLDEAEDIAPVMAEAEDENGAEDAAEPLISDDDIAEMLEEVADDAPAAPPPAIGDDLGGPMSDEEIANLLEETTEPAEPVAIDLGGPMSDDEMAGLLEEASEAPAEPVAIELGRPMSDEEMAGLLEEASEAPAEPVAIELGRPMSDEEMAGLLEEASDAPAEPVAIDLGGPMSDEEMAGLLEEASEAPAEPVAIDLGGPMSDDEMAGLLEEALDAPAEPVAIDLGGPMSDEEMAGLLEEASDAPAEPVEIELGRPMSDDEIAGLLEEVAEDEEPAPEPPPAPAPPPADGLAKVAAAMEKAAAKLDKEEAETWPGI